MDGTMQVSLLALGGGTEETVTEMCSRILQQAECILGASRLLQGLPASCTRNRVAATKPQQILDALQKQQGKRAAVVYSGDTGFCSGCRNLIPLLEQNCISYTVYPGVSSVQMLAAALHRPWQEWILVSAHGVSCDAVAAVMQGKPAFFLTGGSLGVPQLCRQLAEAGLGDLQVTVGERLSYPDQRLTTGTAAEMAEGKFAPLCVLLVEPAPVYPPRSPGWPDENFVHGQVPMTKRYVRAAILASLGIRPGQTVWDVGAGTGSVSVEMAAAAQGGPVYAVECEDQAIALIEDNRVKFRAWNLHIISGHASRILPSLPAPDAVFVGGSKGEMEVILLTALEKNPDVRICISCIALETLEKVLSFCRNHGLQPRVAQLSVAESRQMGKSHLMMAQNPVFLITVHCDD